jgi:hypothetical protein
MTINVNLLFTLAIEPLAERIRQDPNVTGVGIGKHEYQLNVFADDLLICLTYLIFSKYSKISGYKNPPLWNNPCISFQNSLINFPRGKPRAQKP